MKVNMRFSFLLALYSSIINNPGGILMKLLLKIFVLLISFGIFTSDLALSEEVKSEKSLKVAVVNFQKISSRI